MTLRVPSHPCGFQDLSPQTLWWQGRDRSSHQSTPGWPFKGNCWIEGIGADYRVSKTDKRVFLAETAKEMDVISQNVSMDWVCVYCPETGEQVLLMTVTSGPCSCLWPGSLHGIPFDKEEQGSLGSCFDSFELSQATSYPSQSPDRGSADSQNAALRSFLKAGRP